jgi:enoyl-CoA hydratase/carnithine racemase
MTTQTPVSPPAAEDPALATPLTQTVRRHVTDDQICILTFDRPDSAANVFDRAALMDLNEQIDYVQCNANLRGLVLTSAKKSIFIAGADLTQLAGARSPGGAAGLDRAGATGFQPPRGP